MTGSENDNGIIQRSIDLIFSEFERYASVWKNSLTFSVFEVYNDDIYDLSAGSSKPKITSINKIGNLVKVSASNKRDFIRLWSKAMQNRSTAATIGNVCSSRSHAITQLHIEGKHIDQNTDRMATISLVDLAGSESAKTTENMNETKAINSSLSALIGVVSNLKKKLPVVDFNQNILTKILKPALTGKSKTLLITNLSTCEDDLNASLNTTRFSSTVHHI